MAGVMKEHQAAPAIGGVEADGGPLRQLLLQGGALAGKGCRVLQAGGQCQRQKRIQGNDDELESHSIPLNRESNWDSRELNRRAGQTRCKRVSKLLSFESLP